MLNKALSMKRAKPVAVQTTLLFRKKTECLHGYGQITKACAWVLNGKTRRRWGHSSVRLAPQPPLLLVKISTGCPKVRVNFEVPGFSLICWPIPKPFGMVNPHKLRFGLVYNKPCNVLLTSREYGIKFEKILKEEKRWKFWHKGFFEMFMDSGTPCMLKKLSFIILRCTPIEICLTWER